MGGLKGQRRMRGLVLGKKRKEKILPAKWLEEFLTLKMSWDERRYDPLSLWAHSHVCCSGRSTDKGDS